MAAFRGARAVRAVPQGAQDTEAVEALEDGRRRLCGQVIPAARKDNLPQGTRQLPGPRDASPSEIPSALLFTQDEERLVCAPFLDLSGKRADAASGPKR